MDLELKPLQELSEARLAAEFGVSRTPVREAFQRLSRCNLIDVFPQRGTFIAPINIQRVNKARFIWVSIERPLVRLAAEKITESMLIPLQREIVMQRTFAQFGDTLEFLRSDDHFHSLIAQAAGYGSIWDELQETKLHLDRIRRISFLSEDHMLRIADEHEDIFKTLAAHDADLAEKHISKHLDAIFDDVDAIRSEHPDYFIDEPLSS